MARSKLVWKKVRGWSSDWRAGPFLYREYEMFTKAWIDTPSVYVLVKTGTTKECIRACQTMARKISKAYRGEP